MTFQNPEWLYWAIPSLLLLAWLRFRRRHFWGYSLVEYLHGELDGPSFLLRLPRILEALAIGFLLVALLGPVYPAVLERTERAGLQFLLVLDLSLSMEREGLEPGSLTEEAFSFLTGAAPRRVPVGAPRGSKMEAIKKSAMEFVRIRKDDAFGLVVFSNNGYLVTPPTFDHESLGQYLQTTGSHSISNEGFTAIGEGLATANQFFADTRQRARGRTKGRAMVLLTDGENNFGRDPIQELRRARSEGTRVYYMGVALPRGLSQVLSTAVRATGGSYFDVRNSGHLQQAFDKIDQMEKGIFHTSQLRLNQPAYFPFALLSAACLALRLALHAVPDFVELS